LIAITADNAVPACAAIHYRASGQDVVSVASKKLIPSLAARDLVVSCIAKDGIGAAAAPDGIVSLETVHNTAGLTECEHASALRSGHNVMPLTLQQEVSLEAEHD
jgi:hypothetical protein